MAKKPFIIALEEHYLDPEVKRLGGGPGADRDIVEGLDDRGALRIREMDEVGRGGFFFFWQLGRVRSCIRPIDATQPDHWP